MIVKQGRFVRGAARLALAALSLTTAGQALAGEYVVKFKDIADAEAVATAKSFNGMQIVDSHTEQGLVAVELGALQGKELAKSLASLMARDDVEYVVENFKLHTFGVPNDPKYSEQWALAKVRAAEAWDLGTGSRQVTVAVIDTGVDYNHPDLKSNIWTNPGEIPGNGIDDDGNGLIDDVHGWDYLDNDKDPNDATSSQNPGHGTHCAGIVGAVGDNGTGISGMSQQVSIIPLRFIGPNGQGDLMAAIKSIDYAIKVKADIISASWGAKISPSQAQPLTDAVGRANDAGIVFVAAAANDGANNDTTPMMPANAGFPNVISVAASDNNDGKPSWSNYGRAMVSLASPGLNIMSTLPADKYGNLSGTSMATPLVAGLVALLKSQRNLSAQEVLALLQSTGTKVNIETACMCRVDAAAAMTAINTNKLQVVPAAGTFAPNATATASAFGGAGGYTFSSSNPAILDVTASGAMTAKAVGEATLKVTDSAGAVAESLAIRVAEGSGGGGGSEECPLGDPMMCELMCGIMPQLPWCN